jgi:hypothetical protein
MFGFVGSAARPVILPEYVTVPDVRGAGPTGVQLDPLIGTTAPVAALTAIEFVPVALEAGSVTVSVRVPTVRKYTFNVATPLLAEVNVKSGGNSARESLLAK